MSTDLHAAEAPQSAPSHLPRTEAYYRLKADMEDFLYAEADLLDERRFREWLNLLADDVTYFMPIRRNVKFGQHAQRENTVQGEGISWFDEDKWTLSRRVEQLMTGVHWAEEPLSRISHMVTNIRLLEVRPSMEEPEEVVAGSRFLVYQNRGSYETNLFVGRRTDMLRKTGRHWKLAKREIILDQNVLLAKSLTTFF